MRKKLTRQILLLCLFVISLQFSFAQKDPIKFGKIDIQDLRMTKYEPDTSAEAVVLCDYGVFNPDEYEFTRICRIKILKKSGADQANMYIRSGSDVYIKGRTYNLVDGEIEVTKMRDESIFEVKVERIKFGTRFTLPNVQVGSIIEYTYTHQGFPYQWLFQREIPVKWSELRMPSSPFIIVQKNFFGFELLDINDGSRYVAKNMPAFRKEPYMNSVINYLTKFEFEVQEVSIPGRFYEKFTTSWEEISEDLLDNYYFGQRLRADVFLNKEAREIKEMNLSDLEKAKYAYELIKKEVAWNESERIYAIRPLNFVYNNEKVGNCAEINLILVALLKKLEFDADPVVLSTRENGMLSPIYPTVRKLDYVIARIKINDEYYLLDATERKAPFGLLPERCLNGEGRLIIDKKTALINLESKTKSKEVIYANLTLANTGEISGDISHRYIDYAAYDFRKQMENYVSEDEYVNFLESKHAGLNINEYEISELDNIYKPVQINYNVDLQNDAQLIADNIYVNLTLTEKIDDNPFKIVDRKYPVDFIYPIERTYILNLALPTDYVVSELPKSTKITLPNGKGSFLCSIVNSGNKIQYTYNFMINNPIILPNEYEYLKQFYEMIIAKHAESVIIKKLVQNASK